MSKIKQTKTKQTQTKRKQNDLPFTFVCNSFNVRSINIIICSLFQFVLCFPLPFYVFFVSGQGSFIELNING